MGVIWVVAEAMKLGFRNGHPDWSNLGQGQPEVGPMEGAPERLSTMELEPHDHAYGPVGGTGELREVVAEAMKLGFRNGHPDWANLARASPKSDRWRARRKDSQRSSCSRTITRMGR